MKIYCSRRRRYENELDEFIGQDVWVKVDIVSKTDPNLVCGRDYWVRIEDKLYDGEYNYDYPVYKINKVNENSIALLGLFISLQSMLQDIEYPSCDTLRLCKPVEVLSTTELIERIREG